MKRRLLRVVEHDPDTNQDEIEYRKILQEFQKRSTDDDENTFKDSCRDLMAKLGLKNFKAVSPKYEVVYTKIKYGMFLLAGFVMSLIYQSNISFFNSMLRNVGLYNGEDNTPIVMYLLALSLSVSTTSN